MNKKIKREWVVALRSGKYTQGRSALCTSQGKFCCMGVLLDACVVGDWIRSGPRGRWRFMDAIAYLPEKIAQKFGIEAQEQIELAIRNDAYRLSFDAIADYIEEKL